MKTYPTTAASNNPKKWGNHLIKELQKKGFKVFPVHPKEESIEGEKCYSKLTELPSEVSNLIFAVKPEIVEEIIKECPDAGIKRVWMQKGMGKGSVSKEAIEYCKENNIDYVYGVCPMMFLPPVGPHKIHYFLAKLFGGLPKELKN